MAKPAPDIRGDTRTQLIRLLRARPGTVNELADSLALTDNAVRAHLAELQEQGLVIQCGERPGFRKPHALFTLTPRAQELLSHLYAPALTTLIQELSATCPAEQVQSLLRGVGHRLAEPHREQFAAKSPAARLPAALHLLQDLGADARLEKREGKTEIQGQGCPLATAVAHHPAACALVETFLSDLLQQPVREHCRKGPSPSCCFTVSPFPDARR